MLFYNSFQPNSPSMTEHFICPKVNYNSTSDVQVRSLKTDKYVTNQINPIIPENFSKNFLDYKLF